jgi:hypothetical protein
MCRANSRAASYKAAMEQRLGCMVSMTKQKH